MQQLNSYADIATYAGTDTLLDVAGVCGPGDGTYGRFYRVTSAPMSAPAVPGMFLYDALGNPWKRDFYGPINPAWCRASASDTPSQILQAALYAGVNPLFCPSGAQSVRVAPQSGSVWALGQQGIVIPQYGQLGSGGNRRDVIYNYDGAGAAIEIANANYCHFAGGRIGLSALGSAGVYIHAENGPTARWGSVYDIEVAGVDNAGQIGFYAVASGSSIVTELNMWGCTTFGVDIPERFINCEANFNIAHNYDVGVGAANRVLIDRQSHASVCIGRVAGNPAAGFVGMREKGARNAHTLIVDCGSSGKAVDVGNVGNTLDIHRPELLTPFGHAIAGNQVIGEQGGITAADITLSTAWGANAAVAITAGADSGSFTFTVQVQNGAAVGQYPVVTIVFPDGAWNGNGGVSITRTGGSDGGSMGVFSPNYFDDSRGVGVAFRLGGTPIPGGIYGFTLLRR